MSTYQERIDAFRKHARSAAILVENNRDLFLSVDEKDAFRQVAAAMRLCDSIEPPTTDDEAYSILAELLGELLSSGKIPVKPYGLSALGNAQYQALVARVETPVTQVAPLTPQEQYADVVAVYNGPTHILNAKMKTQWKSRFDEAVAAGAI